MIDVNELRKGVTFELDGNLYKVLDYSHNKTGRGNANIRIKARNLHTAQILNGPLAQASPFRMYDSISTMSPISTRTATFI
ncbi:MAG: hypothetical protein ACXW4M_03775, partial [Anaerolineales bacterium]